MQQFHLSLLSAVLLASCAITADAQEIKVGSVIQLRNQAASEGGDRYLEVHGNAHDLPAFKTEGFADSKFLFANSSKDRDKLAGSWKVVSVEKKQGDPLAYGDKIRLQSVTRGGVYLTDVDYSMSEEFGKAFKAKGIGEMDAFFAFAQQISASLVSDWFVGSGDSDTMAMIKKGTKVKAGDAIILESLSHGGRDSAFRKASTSLFLLQASFSTAQVPIFKNYKNRNLVFSSRYNGRSDFPQDMRWIVSLDPSAAPAPRGDVFPLRGNVTLAQGRKYFSESGKHYLVFQPDGNLVVYTAANQFVWGLNTITPKFTEAKIAEFQAEGNLVVYGADQAVIWSALTGRRAPDTSAYLTLTAEGVLRLVSGKSGAAIWSSQ